MKVRHFYDPATFTLTYAVYDPATRDAVVNDPVLDFDPGGALTSTGSVEEVAAVVCDERLTLHYVLETHAHADHLSASQYLKHLPAPRLMFPSVQINIDAGRLPARRRNGHRYLAVPLNLLREADDVGTPRRASP